MQGLGDWDHFDAWDCLAAVFFLFKWVWSVFPRSSPQQGFAPKGCCCQPRKGNSCLHLICGGSDVNSVDCKGITITLTSSDQCFYTGPLDNKPPQCNITNSSSCGTIPRDIICCAGPNEGNDSPCAECCPGGETTTSSTTQATTTTSTSTLTTIITTTTQPDITTTRSISSTSHRSTTQRPYPYSHGFRRNRRQNRREYRRHRRQDRRYYSGERHYYTDERHYYTDGGGDDAQGGRQRFRRRRWELMRVVCGSEPWLDSGRSKDFERHHCG